jgi:hypothetical protein
VRSGDDLIEERYGRSPPHHGDDRGQGGERAAPQFHFRSDFPELRSHFIGVARHPEDMPQCDGESEDSSSENFLTGGLERVGKRGEGGKQRCARDATGSIDQGLCGLKS